MCSVKKAHDRFQLDAVGFNCSECLAGRPVEAVHVAHAACNLCLDVQHQAAEVPLNR